MNLTSYWPSLLRGNERLRRAPGYVRWAREVDLLTMDNRIIYEIYMKREPGDKYTSFSLTNATQHSNLNGPEYVTFPKWRWRISMGCN